jgi:hypothetical protein
LETLNRNRRRAEGMTWGAAVFWGIVISTPTIIAAYYWIKAIVVLGVRQ